MSITDTTTFRDLRDRLMNEPQFRTIVDQMYAMMVHHKVTPYELRDAAYMACIKFANLNYEPRAIFSRFPEDYQEIMQAMGLKP